MLFDKDKMLHLLEDYIAHLSYIVPDVVMDTALTHSEVSKT